MYAERAKRIDRQEHGAAPPEERCFSLLVEAMANLARLVQEAATGRGVVGIEDRLGDLAVSITTAMAYMNRDIIVSLEHSLNDREFGSTDGKRYDDQRRRDAVHHP